EVNSPLFRSDCQVLPVGAASDAGQLAGIGQTDAHQFFLPGLSFPHARDPIVTAADQTCAIGAETDTCHRASMSLQAKEFAPGLHVPEPHSPILVAGGKAFAIGTEADAGGVACATLEIGE